MIKKTTYGYTVEKDNVFLDVVFYSDSIVRFSYSEENKLPDSTIAVIAKPMKMDVELKGHSIKTKDLQIKINENSLTVEIYDIEGNLINKDKKVDLNNIQVSKELLDEKAFYGMGEKYGWINKIGTDTVNWNSDVLGNSPIHTGTVKEYHTSIPFYIGLSQNLAYGIYFDNTYRTYFDFGKKVEDTIDFRAEDGRIDYFFIYGPQLSKVVRGYSDITGSMPLPRKDFLGYQQCRWSYENRDELMTVAKKMREENIPCDILYLDIDYMKDYKVFTVDSEKFKEFKEMNDILKGMGYKLVVIIDPGVKKEEGYNVYDEGVEKDYFVKDSNGKIYIGEVWPGDSAFPDYLREEVRNWWGELHRELIDYGVDGIWNDMNEPANFCTEAKTIPENTIHMDDKGQSRTHKEIHNIYAMLEAQGTYEGLKKISPNKRPFVLTRAAFAGTQRYAALWTGDNSSIWEHLESSMAMFMNLGLSGYSFIGGDVGGFTHDSNGELLTRWTQLGAFTPLFRNHSAKGTINQEPWCFGDETLDITKKYIKLRYNFITYLYNLMKDSSDKGDPVLRPLFYHYQNDENTYNISDQFMFGENIMICPITRPKTNHRMIYLPEGKWYDYWTQEVIQGGKFIIKKAELDTLPIYIKASSIIPMDKITNYIGEEDNSLEIHYYYGEKGKYNLYLDDGLSFDYKNGKYTEIKFEIEPVDEYLTISGEVIHEGYDIPNIKIVIHGFVKGNKVTIEGDKLNFDKEKRVRLNINK
ncbi:DUF4968 domain-containing protein [Clostridium sp. D2Q-11]|uniref:DUF4968 domain-containing protein n=1 Tax=Anaeromonas frigoriresistens TaxID=2683708 RepID=A0A942Z9G6_9FIRM|nr:TIM-barrel domain-containing protein [Anaeromonas frigoriresistens]MBS4539109.1 DUF4968 domain-containing protein [Anaeromonas frigoriresistens]